VSKRTKKPAPEAVTPENSPEGITGQAEAANVAAEAAPAAVFVAVDIDRTELAALLREVAAAHPDPVSGIGSKARRLLARLGDC
jgi:hypothetical protein